MPALKSAARAIHAPSHKEVDSASGGPAASSSYFRVVRGGSLGDAEINIRVSKRSSVLGSILSAVPGTKAYVGDFSPRIGFRCAQSE